MESKNINLEVVTPKTADGWYLRIYHYAPFEKDVVPIPVILCHGLAANKNSCDFGQPGSPDWEHYSLAAYLSQPHNGPVFDVWVPELRGAGQPFFDPHQHPERFHWCVDDYIDYDAPAIVEFVQQWYQRHKQVRPQAFWVGKSMGGMIAYAYGETPQGQQNLKGVVTLGSPVIFGEANLFLEFLTRITPRNVSLPLHVMDVVSRSADLSDHFRGMGANLENMDHEVFQKYVHIGMSDVLSSKVLSQFSLFFRHHTFCRYPSRPWLYDLWWKVPGIRTVVTPYSYTEHLDRFTSPLLVIAGGNDRMAPKKEMKYVVDHVGSKDVSYLEFSKEQGYSADYGHLDLNLGLHAKDEVYPKIYEWLVKRATM